MEPQEYQTLYSFESFYWWYRHLHNIITKFLIEQNTLETPRILDAGCGTGQNIVNLAEKISPDVFGFDLSLYTLAYWQKRKLLRVCTASINTIPFADNVFDFVVSVDVIESMEVDEDEAIAEMIRVTKPGGYICIIVPAFTALMSPNHHQAVHAIRRYSKSKIFSLISKHPGKLHRSNFIFAPVFPIIALYRLWHKVFHKTILNPRSDLTKLPKWLNWCLYKFVSIEMLLLPKIELPFGSSIIAVYQKVT